jgi:hypothetical protein
MAQAGEILNRSGKRYKPAALRTIEQDLRLHVIPALGVHSMSEIARADFQRLVGTWLAEELSASRIHGTIPRKAQVRRRNLARSRKPWRSDRAAGRARSTSLKLSAAPGGVAERLNAAVSKTVSGEIPPTRVRIPPPPPFCSYGSKRGQRVGRWARSRPVSRRVASLDAPGVPSLSLLA